MSDRVTTSELDSILASCLGCRWESRARNALGTAARHHDATGHTVQVWVNRIVTYGDPSAAPPGQTELELELSNLDEVPTR